VLVARRARQVRKTLGLAEPRLRGRAVTFGAIVAAGALLGLAAAQPVVERTRTLEQRTDAEAFVVLDVTRSMLARDDAESQTRIERAKDAAITLRSALAGVPVGVISLTDRVLPHLFPSTNADVFETTIERSLDIEQPPPRSSFATSATRLDSLATIRTQRYFDPIKSKRLLLVLTDGETQPVSGALLATQFLRPPQVETVFVQFWGADERVFVGRVPEAGYRPDPSSRAVLEGVAESVRGSAFDEREVGAAGQKARELLGTGPTVEVGRFDGSVPLAEYLALAAVVPVLFLLWRRDR